MEVLFSNPLIYIIHYPGQDVLELFDRRSGKVGLMVGEEADQFRHEFDDMIASEPALNVFEDFIDDYSALLTEPAVVH